MAYTYSPYEYTRETAPRYDSLSGGYHVPGHPLAGREGYIGNIFPWQQEQAQKESTAFQEYAGDQFKGLFDIVNQLDSKSNPLNKFAAAPAYSPYGGTRADFTTTKPSWYDSNQDRTYPARDIVDDKGYLDARFGHINDYLGGLSSFFGNLGTTGGSNERVQQRAAQQAEYASSLPKVGALGNMGGVPQTGGLSGFAQATPGSNYGGWGGGQVSGGWGSHPVVGGLLG